MFVDFLFDQPVVLFIVSVCMCVNRSKISFEEISNALVQ